VSRRAGFSCVRRLPRYRKRRPVAERAGSRSNRRTAARSGSQTTMRRTMAVQVRAERSAFMRGSYAGRNAPGPPAIHRSFSPQTPRTTAPRSPTDDALMQRCLDLAARGAGHASPNPLVGAVLVSPDGEVLGEGWHRAWGGPHAEVEAVRDAEARGHAGRLAEATLYVSLEPCSHHGKTPPCTDLVLERRIPRVVVAHEDPFPEVAGRGLRRLRAAGVDVAVGVLAREARRLNEAFLRHVTTGRPLVTLKWAQTLDGQVATASGDSRWVSSEESRALVHRWRA